MTRGKIAEIFAKYKHLAKFPASRYGDGSIIRMGTDLVLALEASQALVTDLEAKLDDSEHLLLRRNYLRRLIDLSYQRWKELDQAYRQEMARRSRRWPNDIPRAFRRVRKMSRFIDRLEAKFDQIEKQLRRSTPNETSKT